jgi:hypothetical protein
VSDWFFMLGEPLSPSELAQVAGYLRGLGLDAALPVESVPDFAGAAKVIAHPEWNRGWWDAERRERDRLLAKAVVAHGSAHVLQALSRSTDESISSAHGAAAVQAARVGCGDAGLIRAAAGALGEALHQAKLAELAGEGAAHPFSLKCALFAGGHWPLGVVMDRFFVF